MNPRVMVFCASDPRAPHVCPETLQSINALRWSEPFDIFICRDDFEQVLAGDAKTENVAMKYARAREIFLGGDYEVLLSIEADQVAPPDALEKLMAVDADIAYGLYCSRPNKDHRWMLRRGESLGIDTARYTPQFLRSVWNRIVPSDGLGTGCTLIHRKVLEEIEFHWSPERGHDWHLAKEARAAGFKQMHDCRVHVGHILDNGDVVWPDPETTFRIGAASAQRVKARIKK